VLHPLLAEFGNRVGPPQVTKLWLPQPPSSPFRTIDCEDKERRRKFNESEEEKKRKNKVARPPRHSLPNLSSSSLLSQARSS